MFRKNWEKEEQKLREKEIQAKLRRLTDQQHRITNMFLEENEKDFNNKIIELASSYLNPLDMLRTFKRIVKVNPRFATIIGDLGFNLNIKPILKSHIQDKLETLSKPKTKRNTNFVLSGLKLIRPPFYWKGIFEILRIKYYLALVYGTRPAGPKEVIKHFGEQLEFSQKKFIETLKFEKEELDLIKEAKVKAQRAIEEPPFAADMDKIKAFDKEAQNILKTMQRVNKEIKKFEKSYCKRSNKTMKKAVEDEFKKFTRTKGLQVRREIEAIDKQIKETQAMP